MSEQSDEAQAEGEMPDAQATPYQERDFGDETGPTDIPDHVEPYSSRPDRGDELADTAPYTESVEPYSSRDDGGPSSDEDPAEGAKPE